MFPESSRYFGIEIATLVLPDGREVRYVRRRFVPEPTGLIEETVAGGERLDQLANKKLRDPKQFWRLCDFNRTLEPLELEVEDFPVRIPSVAGQGATR